jgi:NAD+ synthase (glutamine-hydrolysing)
MIRIALAQINPALGDFDENRGKIVRYIQKAEDGGADLVLFPELVITGYPPEDLLFKKKFISRAYDEIKKISASVRSTCAVVGFPHEKDGKLYNAAAIIRDGRLTGVAHKSELPNYGVFDEKRYFAPAEKTEPVVIAGVGVAVTICEDIWVREGRAADLCARPDAGLIVNISSSPYHLGKTELRRATAGAWAARFGKPLAYCNLVGGQDELVFDGGSFVCDKSGRILSSAGEFCEDLLMVDLDVGPGKKNGAAVTPRITPSFEYPQNAYEALKLGLRDYMGKNGFKSALVAVSGGVDSALTAYIAVGALGAEKVRGVAMPSPFSSEGSLADAKELARNLGMRLDVIPIAGLMDGFDGALEGMFEGTPRGIAEENIQARIRGTLIMALSNKFGDLVITTGNKSELSVGYCTLYGDTAGGFALIKDLPKTKVYDLCRWINGRPGWPKIPDATVSKEPSAELRPNQRDSDSLPEYGLLDAILKCYVEDEKSIEEIVALGYSEREVKRVAELVDKSEYKRRQTAPGVKITPKAFGKDRRMPITNKFRDWGERDK